MNPFTVNDVVRVESATGAVTSGRVIEIFADQALVQDYLGRRAAFHFRHLRLDTTYIELVAVERNPHDPDALFLIAEDGRRLPVMRGSQARRLLDRDFEAGREPRRFAAVDVLGGEVHQLHYLPDPVL